MSAPPLNILFEDNHLLVVVKPAGLPTMGVDPQRESLVTLARQYIKRKYDKPGNVFLGIVSRLDAPVTGIVVIARTSKAAGRLTEQFRRRDVDKRYWALVERCPDPRDGEMIDWLRKEERLQKVLVRAQETPGAREARLRYRTVGQLPRAIHLEIELLTGRKHQIRVQLAARRLPVLGDRKYGSRADFEPGIALHARQLCFEHPVRKTPVEFVAPLPTSWRRFGIQPADQQ